MVKPFGSTGLQLQELSKVAVKAIREDWVMISPGGVKQMPHIPGILCRELLDYADRCGRRAHEPHQCVHGNPVAKVPEEKGNPRCLRKLYLSTREGIERNIALLVEQALEQEQMTIGWEE